MNRILSLFLVLASGSVAFAQTKLPTVDDALKLSAATGRPVFAMAGRET